MTEDEARAKLSVIFAEYGDPQTWPSRTYLKAGTGSEEIRWGFAFTSDQLREAYISQFAAWVAGEWNGIEGVEPPGPENKRFHHDLIIATAIRWSALFASRGDPRTWFESEDQSEWEMILNLYDDWKAGLFDDVEGVTPSSHNGG